MTTHLMAIGFSPQVRASINHREHKHHHLQTAHRLKNQAYIHLRGKQLFKAPIKKPHWEA